MQELQKLNGKFYATVFEVSMNNKDNNEGKCSKLWEVK